MRRVSGTTRFAAGVLAAIAAGSLTVPVARADDSVTYEVVSDSIGVANIEYQDAQGRVAVSGATLPWRMDVTMPNPQSAPPHGAQVRADWRPDARPNRWVSVRVIYHGRVFCQNTLDIGDAACYGNTPRIT